MKRVYDLTDGNGLIGVITYMDDKVVKVHTEKNPIGYKDWEWTRPAYESFIQKGWIEVRG